MPSATRVSLSDTLIEMNQDENAAPQSQSRSSKLKSSGSTKSSKETQGEKLKCKRGKKDKKERMKENTEKKEEPKSKDSIEITPKRSKKEKAPEQVIPTPTPVRSTYKGESSTETPEETLNCNTEKKDKKERNEKEEEKNEKDPKSKDSSETPEEKAQRRKERKEEKESKKREVKQEKESKSKHSSETPEEKAQRRKEKKDKKDRKKERKEKESKSKHSSETSEEKAQRRKEKKENTKEMEGLMRTIKTLQHRVEEVESENRHLNEEYTAMQDLETRVNQAEEQLEYATEENHEFSIRVHALEQALVVQEAELDNALATIRKQKNLERKLLEAESAADSVVGDAELAYHAHIEEQLVYREELDAIHEELELLRDERDKAIDRAIRLSIGTAKLKAEVSESNDRVTECKVVIEQLRMLTQHSSSASVCSVSKKMDRRSSTSSVSSFSGLPISIVGLSTLGSLWGFSNKDDDKSIVSNYDDDCMLDPTEDNTTSEGSEEDWDLEQTDFPEQPSVIVC